MSEDHQTKSEIFPKLEELPSQQPPEEEKEENDDGNNSHEQALEVASEDHLQEEEEEEEEEEKEEEGDDSYEKADEKPIEDHRHHHHQEKEEEECKTPTSSDKKIPRIQSCPPTPKKKAHKSFLHKRKLPEFEFFEASNREEVDSFFRSTYGLSSSLDSPPIKRRCRSY